MPEPAGGPFLRPIPIAWVATGPYGAPNYDEFASCEDVRAAFAAHPDSIVAADNPGCFGGGLVAAAARLADAKARYRRTSGLFRYALDDCLATVGLVSTDEISSGPGEPGRLLRNEDVFADKVVERRALIEQTRHLISAVLLVPDEGEAYGSLLARTVPDGAPLVEETDERGVTHRIWPLGSREIEQELARRTFLVADGNHRSLAAQQAGLGWCLAVVADPAGLRIAPYHRLLDASADDLLAAAAPFDPTPVDRRDPVQTYLHVAGQTYLLRLPETGNPVERLPHTVLERRLIVGALGLDPAAVTYVGGDVADELTARVDRGDTGGALLMRPVTTAEFVAVNAARLQMPRKSTWFLPKARSGLVIAEL